MMKKQDEQRLVPKLRFKGFSEDWEQRKLGEVFKYEQPTKYLVTNTDYSDDYCTPVLTAGQSFILGYTDETEGIKKASKEKPVIIFDDFTTGNHYVDFPFKIKSSALKILSISDKSYDDYFTFYSLNRIKYSPQNHQRHWISMFSSFKVNIPIKSEQASIGNLLRTLDNMITLHNLKKEKIEKLKLDLVRRLDFSLTEESDEVVLGDLIEIKSGYGFKSEEFSNNGIPLVRISDIDSGTVKKPGTFIKEDSKYIDFLIKSGDYLIAMSGATTGKVGRYTLNHDAYCNQRIGIIRGIENKIDNNYLEYVLHSSKFQHYISTQWGAGAQPNINLKQIKDYKLRLPKLSEQKLIGSIFANLNRQKDIHKVDQLLSLKELYLNKLFI